MVIAPRVRASPARVAQLSVFSPPVPVGGAITAAGNGAGGGGVITIGLTCAIGVAVGVAVGFGVAVRS